ncbi:MAG: SRPBCC family protein [Solirubrobacterales bacterium]
MKLEHSFEVNAPIDRVWETMIDVERVAPCLPGAEITEAQAGGTYAGTFTVKLGPTTAAYAGKLELTQVDEAAHRVEMHASGRDKRGQGSANATISSSMETADGGTKVDVATDFTLTGRLARFGRGGMIEDVSNRLVGDFVNCLKSTIEPPEATDAPAAPPPTSQPVRGGSLFLSVLWARIKRFFARLFGRGGE